MTLPANKVRVINTETGHIRYVPLSTAQNPAVLEKFNLQIEDTRYKDGAIKEPVKATAEATAKATVTEAPEAKKKTTDKDATDANIDGMKFFELKKYAKEQGIEVTSTTTKAELLTQLNN